MKKEKCLSNIMGVTQHEMAMLLRVNRSQLTMYELGHSTVPLTAQQLLSEILAHLKTTDFLNNNKLLHYNPKKRSRLNIYFLKMSTNSSEF